ncbi:MAG: hypothetical protein K8R57_09715 [Verrucomicrobia bacterium]|nr:hypothetical protein [Verrucomicrobiota bacterium]
MSIIRCASCAQDSSSSLVYCSHCGAILPKTPKTSQGDGSAPLLPSVAIAAGRAQRFDEESKEKRSLFSHLLGIFRYLLLVALGVAFVLALMDPKSPLPDSRPIANAPAILQQNILGSRGVPVTISQQLINQALAQAGKIQWAPPFDFIPMPQWMESSVILTNGALRFSVTITLMSYPLHLSESFSLSGGSRQWNLMPESGSLGLLPLNGPLLSLITPFMNSCSAPFAKELQVIKGAETVRIRPGYIDLITRP